MKELLPIKFFSKREEDKQRVEGNSSKDLPKWVLKGEELCIKSEMLSDALTNVVSEVEWDNRAVPLIIQAKMNKDAHAKSHRKKIESLFATRTNNVIGVGGEDTLIIKVDSLDDAKIMTQELQNTEQNAYGISGIDEVLRFEARVEYTEGKTNYKIRLLDFCKYGSNQNNILQFERLLIEKNIDYVRSDYGKALIIFKLCDISFVELDKLRQIDIFDLAEEIVPMPSFEIALDSISTKRTVAIKRPDDNKTTTVGVLDNGIEPIDELKPWLNDSRFSPYPDSSILATHGTFVAGVITYGDELQEKELTGCQNIKVFDAAIFPDTKKEKIEEDELIANIKEVIRKNHQRIRIWNLSISFMREISYSRFSDFAIALDLIQDEFNVLICKSTGNCTNFVKGGMLGKLCEGADSVRSLVVGSIAEKQEGLDIAAPNNPSPFSRKGPGPAFIIKPDIVHYGGNAGVDSLGNIVQTGVYSFSKYGDITEMAGTSFSTPRVAALAAGLMNELDENFDSLLIKSLIIHSASYSANLDVPEFERTKYLGFGLPATVNKILYNAPDEGTLILRDVLPKGSYIDIKDFPMPDCLIRDGFFTGQIIVTLVYEPVLNPSQGFEYCQSNMEIKFGTYDEKEIRDTTRNGILNPIGRKGSENMLRESLYSKVKMRETNEDFAQKERMLIQYGDKYYPVKKYAVDLSELTDGNKIKCVTSDKKWYLKLEGTYRTCTEDLASLNGIDLRQEYCLIITIKDPTHKGDVYNGITQKLDQFNFWHTNIKVSENINIEI